MAIVFMLPHVTYNANADTWRCWACNLSGDHENAPKRWAHEEAHEGHEVELPFEDPRVEAYIDWAFSIEDSELEAAEEIARERREGA
jgi:hypothetical protein